MNLSAAVRRSHTFPTHTCVLQHVSQPNQLPEWGYNRQSDRMMSVLAEYCHCSRIQPGASANVPTNLTPPFIPFSPVRMSTDVRTAHQQRRAPAGNTSPVAPKSLQRKQTPLVHFSYTSNGAAIATIPRNASRVHLGPHLSRER